MSPQPWRVERGFSSCRILAADDSVVADGLTLDDSEAIVAAMRVAEAEKRRDEEIYAALAAYDEATLDDSEAIVAAMRIAEAEKRRNKEIYAALAAYDEATR